MLTIKCDAPHIDVDNSLILTHLDPLRQVPKVCIFSHTEVLLLDGKPHLIRKRETLEDITRNQLMLEL